MIIENQGRGMADDVFAMIDGARLSNAHLDVSGQNSASWFRYVVEAQHVFVTGPSFHKLVPSAPVVMPFKLALLIDRNVHGPIELSATCGASNSIGMNFGLNLSPEDSDSIYENIFHDWKGDPMGQGAMDNSMKRVLKACEAAT